MATFLFIIAFIFALIVALPLPRFVLGIALCCLSGGGVVGWQNGGMGWDDGDGGMVVW